jgi:dihydroneopterin aldolase
MQDTLFVRDLEARAVIGVTDWERRAPQVLKIDLDLACDAAAAAEEDDIAKTVNYRSVSKAVLAHTEASGYRLVETLAERLADLIRSEYGVRWVRIRIHKPGAVRFSRDVGVVIERGDRGEGGAD